MEIEIGIWRVVRADIDLRVSDMNVIVKLMILGRSNKSE